MKIGIAILIICIAYIATCKLTTDFINMTVKLITTSNYKTAMCAITSVLKHIHMKFIII